jgi:ADP-heptose:LPS heptosyltransferase
MGVDPAGVPAREKRNRINLPLPIVKEVGDALQDLTNRYVILHPMSGDLLRNMPVDVFRRLCRMGGERLDCDVATLVPLPEMHDRHLDLSAISSRGYLQYCGLVQRSVGLISVDTSIYHIADAFDVPAVVVFSTFQPKLRAAYYPRTDGLILPGMDPHAMARREASGDKVTARDVMQFWLDVDLDELVRRLADLMQAA